MSTEENKAIVRRFAEEILNEKRLDRADEIMAQDYIDHGAMTSTRWHRMTACTSSSIVRWPRTHPFA
jgi:predicted SnoaL-like aldol condensation-catalyzing enzyme